MRTVRRSPPPEHLCRAAVSHGRTSALSVTFRRKQIKSFHVVHSAGSSSGFSVEDRSASVRCSPGLVPPLYEDLISRARVSHLDFKHALFGVVWWFWFIGGFHAPEARLLLTPPLFSHDNKTSRALLSSRRRKTSFRSERRPQNVDNFPENNLLFNTVDGTAAYSCMPVVVAPSSGQN